MYLGGEPEDDDYPCKCVKEWDSWDNLEEVMQSRIPETNCRWKDEGPSDVNAEVWPKIWDFKLLQQLRDKLGYA